MAKKKQVLYPVVFMVVLTVFFTFLLSFINLATSETIEEQQALVIQRSVLYVFNLDGNGSDEDVQKMFTDTIDIEVKDNRNIYIYKDKNQVKGYAFDFSGKGLWGTITGHIAITPDHKEILGINFVSHSETPGLGGRIDEEEFKSQFRNLVMADPTIVLNKDTGGNLDAISGATLTSLAVRDMVNLNIPEILEFAREEGFYEGN
ncbi:FMN-binding protein [Acidaminobacter sp. JC074]|uniref:FMN-binding protein n=1 Tax=Acidaminobacter sp. JC074 TaxID=2530199 RepID=UPI001F0FD82D|nr:FMN-binding protein [Acidaminobacter sp. JC074]MCH4887678.1 FMN-binding protein [Acidaminobacter sp. JC074]